MPEVERFYAVDSTEQTVHYPSLRSSWVTEFEEGPYNEETPSARPEVSLAS